MGFNGIGIGKAKAGPRAARPSALLDVGTTKIACFVARTDEGGRPRVVGIGHQVSRGVRAGVVIDMEAAERAIRHAVHAAEQMAGETVDNAVVNLTGGHPVSQTVAVDVPISGQAVGDGDLRRALRAYGQAEIAPDDLVVHAIPVGYAIDGHRGIEDPRGMFGERLGVDLHLVTANAAALRNLVSCVERAHLEVEAVVISPYAAGLACLVEDELMLGATVIDMGGGTTSLGVFVGGKLVFSDSVSVGGAHITNDIARGLTTPVAHAERMKTLYGCAIASASDDRELIDVPQVGEDEPAHANHVPRSLLTGIIKPRVEEIFELVRGRLEASGMLKSAGRRVVLTGGASQLHGVRELAQSVLDKQVRMGRPLPVAGLAEATCGPAFATAVGLLAYAMRQQDDPVQMPMADEVGSSSTGFLSRLGGWFRENL